MSDGMKEQDVRWRTCCCPTASTFPSSPGLPTPTSSSTFGGWASRFMRRRRRQRSIEGGFFPVWLFQVFGNWKRGGLLHTTCRVKRRCGNTSNSALSGVSGFKGFKPQRLDPWVGSGQGYEADRGRRCIHLTTQGFAEGLASHLARILGPGGSSPPRQSCLWPVADLFINC
jgi:hypothetical protein